MKLVKVFVVRKDPALTEKDILAHRKANLTGYKVPKFVEFRDELPKTNVGKILRRALRDEKPGMTANMDKRCAPCAMARPAMLPGPWLVCGGIPATLPVLPGAFPCPPRSVWYSPLRHHEKSPRLAGGHKVSR